jgi:hypothetical protein
MLTQVVPYLQALPATPTTRCPATRFTGFISTKVHILTQKTLLRRDPRRSRRAAFSVQKYLLYWYKNTNTDASCSARGAGAGVTRDAYTRCLATQFTCFTITKVQILTQFAGRILQA